MSDITQIRARIETADVGGAETSSWIYLGIAGREFCLDSGSGDDYAVGAKTCFILGEEGGSANDGGETGFTDVTVRNAEYNDPRKPQLDTEDLDLAPAYIRFAGSGGVQYWCLERAKISVRSGTGQEFEFDNLRLRTSEENRRIWLHHEYGERLFLYNVTGN
ncbi:hypothetical protein OH540_13910 [Streptomyces sp. BPPL-273]|uniref:hypothetical protein n=1 Tax=Streptomyces TaxID=1883 RepID=UPI0024AF019B|nr:hypothetical protein [Streptomyces sp. BPPL-273]WHM31082.1 hypothetical protein OH540_13910 [Streptomyces sp. BPPL-273]